MSSAFLPSRVDLVLKEEEIGLSSYGGNGVQEGALWALRTSGGPCVLPDCPKCSTGNQVWHSSRRKRSSDAFTVNAPCKKKHSVLIHPHWHMSDWYPFLPRKQVFTSHEKRLWGLWMPEKGLGDSRKGNGIEGGGQGPKDTHGPIHLTTLPRVRSKYRRYHKPALIWCLQDHTEGRDGWCGAKRLELQERNLYSNPGSPQPAR